MEKILSAKFLSKCICFSLGLMQLWISKDVVSQPVNTVSLESSLPQTILEDEGKVAVLQGKDCEQDRINYVKLLGDYTLPPYANQATLFLNGWHFKFRNGDHHLNSIDIEIFKINQRGKKLSWQTKARIRDDNGDDPYDFCYFYTILAWNDAAINIKYTEPSPPYRLTYKTGTPNHSALNVLSRYEKIRGPQSGSQVAILPRGFDLKFPGDDDHEILQVAYTIGKVTIFRGDEISYFNNSPQVIRGRGNLASNSRLSKWISWDTQAIFKDQDNRRDFQLGDRVGLLHGLGLSVIQPSFSLLPTRPSGRWFNSGMIGKRGIETSIVEIKSIPFTYAVPMLTGWDLSYVFSDEEHVEEIGIWLHDIQYDPDSAILRYKVSSVLNDDDDVPSHKARHNVHILGLDGYMPADLVPLSTDNNFCNRDNQGRLLFDIANRGQGDASASTTLITFKKQPEDYYGVFERKYIDTPAIPRGFQGPLPSVEIPWRCKELTETCYFTINVDVSSEVIESNENNNSRLGECSFPR